MRAVLISHNHPQGSAIVRGALTALRKVWTAHTLKRAIADVASTSEQDYRDFGLDKAGMLTALRRLRDEIEDSGEGAGLRFSRDPLSISMTRRES